MEIVFKYFPDLTLTQTGQFNQILSLYQDWNARINLISRKDIEHLAERHILHSLSLARIITFKPGTKILDAGTGGGFPGIPLAILFPEADFHLVDSIGKKINVVKSIAKQIGLKNVTAEKSRVENINGKYDFVVSRAVTGLHEFYQWTKPLISSNHRHLLNNGILYLKGGDLTGELKSLKKSAEIFSISDFFSEDFFVTKKIVYIPEF